LSGSLNRLYEAIGISKQGVHKLLNIYELSQERRGQLLLVVHQIRQNHPTMGMRDMYYKINPEGMGRDAFEAFCTKEGLRSKVHKNYKRTTDSNGVIRFENLLESTEITRINQVWQSDITYYELGDRFYYLTFIIDAYTRRIVGHNTSMSLSTQMTTLPSLKLAVRIRKDQDLKGLILHSDGGGQYYAKEFVKYTKELGLVNSMCDYAWENGKAERINGVIKNNYLKHRSISNYEDLVKEVDRSVKLYNEDKPHLMLGRMSPVTFEEKCIHLNKQTQLKMTESLEATMRF
jgi:putative transposase